jgi:hypothetical protein
LREKGTAGVGKEQKQPALLGTNSKKKSSATKCNEIFHLYAHM